MIALERVRVTGTVTFHGQLARRTQAASLNAGARSRIRSSCLTITDEKKRKGRGKKRKCNERKRETEGRRGREKNERGNKPTRMK